MKRKITRSLCSSQPRAGWSLMETMLAVTLTTALSVMGAKVILLLIEVDGKLAQSTIRELAIQRFEDQIRRDVESSITAEASDEGINLTRLDGKKIVYRFEDQAIIRTSDEFQTRSREAYRFPDEIITFATEDNVVSVQIASEVPISHQSRTSFAAARQSGHIAIRAILGRASRYARREEHQ